MFLWTESRGFLTILCGGPRLGLALAQLADAGRAAAAGDGGPAPARLLLPQGGAARGHPLGAGDAAGQARDAAPRAAARHRHLGRAGLLDGGGGEGEGEGRAGGGGEDTMGGKVTERLRRRNTWRKEI